MSTRRKQIEEIEENYPSSDGTSSFSNGFVLGAEWADANPPEIFVKLPKETVDEIWDAVELRSLNRQLQSDRTILVEALKEITNDRRIIKDTPSEAIALSPHFGAEAVIINFYYLAIEALKAIGEVE